jgi:hypothetical protein
LISQLPSVNPLIDSAARLVLFARRGEGGRDAPTASMGIDVCLDGDVNYRV